MTNTIPNVPRELLERLSSYIPNGDGHNSQYANDLADAVVALESLSAQSPAGVDGLEVDRNAAFKACPESGCDWGSFFTGWKARGEVDQAIIDGLRGEVAKISSDRAACWAEFKVMTKSCLDAEKERDAALVECERLRDENAILRAGMKGDYDLDAWLEWVKEKGAMLRQEAALLTDARQQLYQACISREDEQQLKAMIDRIDARLAQCRLS